MSAAKYNTLITLGYDIHGKQIRKRITANSKAELNQKIFETRKEYELIKNPSNISFGEYAKKWVDAYKSSKSLRTYQDCTAMLKKFDPISFMELKRIRQIDLQEIINENKDHPRTCQLMRGLLKQIFDGAIEDGIIARSPATKLIVPKYIKIEKRALSISEVTAVKVLKLEPREDFFIKTLYYFGLRPGEALGLMKMDFDLLHKDLTISRSLAFDNNRGYIKPTKTYTKRTIPIPEVLIHDLETFLSSVDTLYIFMKENELITKSQYKYMWKKIRKAINEQLGGNDNMDITKDLTPYIFRHNYATMLYYSNISIKQAAKLLGHADTKMIMEVYAHIDESKENVRAKLNGIMDEKSSEKVLNYQKSS